ncbi:GPI inositol-deacylase B [Yarrowia sp. C11]|nr:GPI inositol-deacylase B [Yarrowia sp. E02]KAG5371322.1 GPI inositol-deacylase B [Yarrowia sp. C11]
MRRININASVALWTVFTILTIWISFALHQPDVQSCDIARKWISTAHIEGFDSKHSRFAEKYSLHLIKASQDAIPLPIRPSGVPVIFAHGNAGGFRQIGPYTDMAKELNEELGLLTKGDAKTEFDFFSVDFNEAYSALHGRTLLDQAEYLNDAISYILDMYRQNQQEGQQVPESVIVLGHSMGGIVARVAVTLENYRPQSVNTIITLASPHLIPAATFDADITKVYHLVNDYWRSAFAEGDTDENPLRDITILSIAGGKSDTMVPSDYVSLDSLVPATNGLSTFTNSIARVWTGIDHDAVMWCHQLRRQVASALFHIVDPDVPSQTKPRDVRMSTFHRSFSGSQSLSSAMQDFINIEAKPLRDGVQQKLAAGFFWGRNLQLLTNHVINYDSQIDLYERKSGSLLKAWQCRSRQGSSFRQCKRIYPLLVPGVDNSVLSHVSVNGILLLDISQEASESGDWINVDEMSMSAAPFNIYGNTVLSTSNMVSQDIAFPALTSGLVSYKVYTSGEVGLIRQYMGRNHLSRTYDSKYLVPHYGRVDISFHGDGAPFVPFKLKTPTKTDMVTRSYMSPLHLQIFGQGKVTISVDYVGSLGNLFMRYRTLLFSLPTAVLYAVLLLQFWRYYHSGSDSKFMSLRDATGLFAKHYLSWACLAAAGLSYFVQFEFVRDLLHSVQIPSTGASKSYEIETFYGSLYTHIDLFLGISGPIGVVLAPAFLALATGIVVIVTEIVVALTTLGSLAISRGRRKISPLETPKNVTIESSDDPVGDLFHKRTVIIALLALLVLLFVPYQLAFALATASLLALTAYFDSEEPTSASHDLSTSLYANKQAQEKVGSFINYTTTMSVVMVWTTLVNIPVLAVWVQGMVIGRSTIFSSHHNLLSILPTLLFIENLSFRRMPERGFPIITYIILGYACYNCVAYGMMHAFMVHHWFNLLAGWLLFTSYKHNNAVPKESRIE